MMMRISLNEKGTMKYPKVSLLLLGVLAACPAWAEEVYELVIQDHRFTPAVLSVPANKKIKVIVKNQDATPEEFESFDLNREKVVSGKSKIMVFIGPLKPGHYKFFGEFHPDTAQGVLEAK